MALRSRLGWVVAIVTVSSGCGTGATLPVSRAGDGGSLGDAGPLACDGDLATFTDLNLANYFGCASCHQSGNPAGRDMAWGPGSGNNTPEGWHTASLTLAMQPDQVGLALAETSLSVHFNGSDGTHPVNTTAKDATEAWLIAIRAIPACAGAPPADAGLVVDAGNLPDAGFTPPDAGFIDSGVDAGCRMSDEDALAAFPAAIVTRLNNNCVGCHSTTGDTPTGLAAAWGVDPAERDAAHWFVAVQVIADRAGQDADPATSILTTHFDGPQAPHGNDDASGAAIIGWQTSYFGEVECAGGDGGPVGDAGPADAGDGGA